MFETESSLRFSDKGIKHWQKVAMLLIAYDALAVSFSYFFALLLRFDFRYSQIPIEYLNSWQASAPWYAMICIISFSCLRLYRSLWRFASYKELVRIITATLITTFAQIVMTCSFFVRMPISYYFVGSLMQLTLILMVRFSYRFALLLRSRRETKTEIRSSDHHVKNVMLIGAGNAGRMILQDIQNASEISDVVRVVIDDNPNKWGRDIEGVKIVGGRQDIMASVKKYEIDKIYLAIPSASPEDRRDILAICKETNCELKTLPGVYQLVNGTISVSKMKKVDIEDLLGRETIKTDLQEVFDYIHGKRVLITGGGGSIGSELARQIASHGPEQLILFDIYENNVYDIQLELREKYPDLNLVVLIGSVRDSRKLFQLFEKYRPQIVYHAAAHKHVPLMEDSPCEAIKNNVIGTYKTAYAAMVHGTERFVLISTDKAVNPTNIMGASKRLCEMVLQSFNAMIKAGKADQIPQLFTHHMERDYHMTLTKEMAVSIKTEYVAVRFGNVLGSNGSVIPIFKRQIEEGGPVTVTHPDIIRYFMTIPEAVSLVLLAGTYAKGGEIFVLDMGRPVKIDDLARNMIKLSGYQPDVDIKIEYTGLRPGEKLYEEKLMAEEGLEKTDNDLIHIGHPIKFDAETFLNQIEDLMNAAYANRGDMKAIVQTVVTTYHPKE